MKKCRHCKGTNFGVTVTETKVSRYRVINGKAEEMLGEPEVSSKTDIVYCFTCNKPITEKDDIYENETCPVCGKTTEELVNGRCKECDEKVKSYSKMTKEQIIMMIMQQGVGQQEKGEVKQEVKQVEKKEEVKAVEQTQTANEVINSSSKDMVSPHVNLNPTVGEDVNLNSEITNENVLEDIPDYEGIQFAPDSGLNNDDDILSQLDNAVPVGSINVLNEF